MARKNQIWNQDRNQQKIIEAQASESGESENQSVDAAVSDHSSEIKHRRLTGFYQVSHPENEVSPCTTESIELNTMRIPGLALVARERIPLFTFAGRVAKRYS